MLTHARSFAFVLQFMLLAEISVGQDQNSPIASQSIVHFTFAEENGAAKD